MSIGCRAEHIRADTSSRVATFLLSEIAKIWREKAKFDKKSGFANEAEKRCDLKNHDENISKCDSKICYFFKKLYRCEGHRKCNFRTGTCGYSDQWLVLGC